MCLASIAGYVDAYGFLTFSTFVSFMSGNTTHAGYILGGGALTAALPALIAILSFLAGVFAGTLVTSSRALRARRILYLSTALLLAAYIAASYLSALTRYSGIALLSLAMGMMNTALLRVGTQPVNLTFVTGTLTQIGRHTALAARRAELKDSEGEWDTHTRRALMLTLIWAGFLGGAFLGGAITPHTGVWTPAIPLLIMLALAVIDPGGYAGD